MVGIDEFPADCFEGIRMIGDFRRNLDLESVGALVDKIGLIAADAFDLPGCDHFLFAVRHRKQSEFQRRTSRVDNQYFHVFLIPSDFSFIIMLILIK